MLNHSLQRRDCANNIQNPLIEKRSRNFGIGQDIQPSRNRTLHTSHLAIAITDSIQFPVW
jgi:hypothetical protein